MNCVQTRKYINERYDKISNDCIMIEKVMFECKMKEDDEGYLLFESDFNKKKEELIQLNKIMNELDTYDGKEKGSWINE